MSKLASSQDTIKLQEMIDLSIKKVWTQHIKEDYQKFYLLKEDTLKNALYYHLRRELKDTFLDENKIRIYTEFYYQNGIADLAIVKLKDEFGQAHLKDEIDEVLAIIELKYKSGVSTAPFENDTQKVIQYIENNDVTQFYLAFIHEVEYEMNSDDSWFTFEQQNLVKGRVTELSGYYIEGINQMIWQVNSHHNMNSDTFPSSMLTKAVIIEAADNFNEEKYSKELYHHYLDVIKNTKRVTPELQEAVRYLLYWKLGKVSTKKTASGVQLPWVDQYGRTYYAAGTTASNNNAINHTLEQNLLQSGLDFKDGRLSYESFIKKVDAITKTSIVLPTFYIHIWIPEEYPILDVKVWRTYLWNKGRSINKYSKPMSWQHYEEYTKFFREMVSETGLDWRLVDKGLWSLGDQVNYKE
jgi:hypothetical protein